MQKRQSLRRGPAFFTICELFALMFLKLCRLLTCYIDPRITTKVGIFIFTVKVLGAGVDMSFFAFFLIFDVVLFFVSHCVFLQIVC